MADQIQLQGPVDVRSDSKERVAFDLMTKIAFSETGAGPARDRDYFLNLYVECHRVVVAGWDLKTTRETVKRPV